MVLTRFSRTDVSVAGIGTNHTILDSNIWGNLTVNDLVQDANKALAVLINQPEVDANKITVL
ncbi:MAG TPA: hypothetical protein VJR94_02950, partial [Candidatus Nitrosocosmicus sp.]|nr:hypothetical protein [Candidatus Nitrosocosmicus sp.]